MTTVTIHIPSAVYHRLERAATQLERSVPDLVAETLEAALPPAEPLPATLQSELATLETLDNTTLQQIATSQMDEADQRAFEQLTELQGIRLLKKREQAQLETLRQEYGRILLRKARAYALLSERRSPLQLE